MSNRNKEPIEVVVLGAGFAGLTFARKFQPSQDQAGRPVKITIIDKQNHHLFQPLLYQVATAALAAPEVAGPVRAMFRGRTNVEVVMDVVESIDLENRRVKCTLDEHRFDYLVIAMGGRTTYYGSDHWEQFAPGLKTLADAFRIRKKMLTAFERAELSTDPVEKRRLMRTVVVGGGPTGVELAGAMADLTRQIWKKDFRHIDIKDAEVILVDVADRVLMPYPPELSAAAQEQLEEIGVEVRLNTKVVDIKRHRVWLQGPDGEVVTHGAGTILWGGGIQAADALLSMEGVERDRAGRVMVEPDLSVPGHPHVLCLGDAAHVRDAEGKPVPGVAPAAMQMGTYAAKWMGREMVGNANGRPAFKYTDKGSMATIGRSKAVANLYNRLPLTGFPAWIAWMLIHLLFLVGFRNKVVTLIQWIYQYVTFKSGARVIVDADRPDGNVYNILRNAEADFAASPSPMSQSA
ncbi:MAG: NAD(P)/FAD-dependent oxidoreductase [Planctomycetota bacterium]